jgi:hypothetical protein
MVATSSSAPSFFTLLTNGDAGVSISESSGAGTSNRLSEGGITFERVHPIVGPALIEQHQHSSCIGAITPFAAQVTIVNVTWG